MSALKITRSLLPLSSRNSNSVGINQKFCQKGPLSLGYVRNVSSINTPPELISKNLSFRDAFDSPITENDRPLVLLYSWLVAKAKHMSKYSDFYLGKGFDVMHIKIQPAQLVWPKHAQKVVSEALDFILERRPHQSQPIMPHGFSVGGYLYGETLVKILKTEVEKYGGFGNRIVGQILDSPVGYEGIPFGMSRAITENALLQATLQGSIKLYLTLLKNQAMKHYKLSFNTFRENSLAIPTMFLYARSDKVAPFEPIEKLIEEFNTRNISVCSKMWENSKHVSHFHLHPVEYIQALNMFLAKVGLVESEPEKLRTQEIIRQ